MGDAHDPYLGRAIHGRYLLIEQIGVGAFGAVYRARDLKNEQECAVKLLHLSAAESAQVSDRFWDEARYIAELCHPHVVESYDYGADADGTLFLCMELLRGRDLGSLLTEVSKLSVEQTLHIVRQVGSALHAVHQANIVHRDLKPKNIFLVERGDREGHREGEGDRSGDRNGDRNGEDEEGSGSGGELPLVKVIDFGLAKYLGAWAQDRDRGSAGMLIGTPDYLPPEAWSGNSSTIDPRADQWSLAVLTYRMLTGRLPFVGDGDMLRVRRAILESTPQPVRALEPSLPEHIEAALSRALSKDKEQRFRDIRDFLRALHDRAPLPLAATPPLSPSVLRAGKRAAELALSRWETYRLPPRQPIPSHTTVVIPAPCSGQTRPMRAPAQSPTGWSLWRTYLLCCGLIGLLGALWLGGLTELESPRILTLMSRIRRTLQAAHAAWSAPRPSEASASTTPGTAYRAAPLSTPGAPCTPLQPARTPVSLPIPLSILEGPEPPPSAPPATKRRSLEGAMRLRNFSPISNRKKRYDDLGASSAPYQPSGPRHLAGRP